MKDQTKILSFSISEEFANIQNFFNQVLVPEAQKFVEKLRHINHPDLSGREYLGGILRLIEFNEETGDILTYLDSQIGNLPPQGDKIADYYHFSEEKILRTFEQYKKEGHNRSDQSLNVEEKQYAGGILVKIGSHIVGISFSGLPQWFDKALDLTILNEENNVTKIYYDKTGDDGFAIFELVKNS